MIFYSLASQSELPCTIGGSKKQKTIGPGFFGLMERHEIEWNGVKLYFVVWFWKKMNGMK